MHCCSECILAVQGVVARQVWSKVCLQSMGSIELCRRLLLTQVVVSLPQGRLWMAMAMAIAVKQQLQLQSVKKLHRITAVHHKAARQLCELNSP